MSPPAAAFSLLDRAPCIPPDAIFAPTTNYLADQHAEKILLAHGAYSDGEGKPWILPSVQLAEEIVKNSGHEYLPIAGLKTFRNRALELIFHGTRALDEGRIASCQAPSGSGSLFMAGSALKIINPDLRDVIITTPSWPSHKLQFETMGSPVIEAPYYKDKQFDLKAYMAALEPANPGSIVILHACAHDPTGCDPTPEQWKTMGAAIKAKRLFPIFDAAYLGFNSGDVDKDAWAVHYSASELGLEMGLALSFAKNMGLYGERIGLVAFITNTVETRRNVDSVFERVQRCSISTPPAYGAKLVSTILGNPELKSQWDKDIVTMSERIISVRQKLYQKLTELQTPGDWSHIIKQTGMFSYLGLSPAQVVFLQERYYIYMLHTGRISMAGLNDNNLAYFAQAVDYIVRETSS
ncbi:aspartate aminotransferase [Cadophora sp. DSE1049]|nr:aspartate aminotransferase [Cadophora sp. DSE1049]